MPRRTSPSRKRRGARPGGKQLQPDAKQLQAQATAARGRVAFQGRLRDGPERREIRESTARGRPRKSSSDGDPDPSFKEQHTANEEFLCGGREPCKIHGG